MMMHKDVVRSTSTMDSGGSLDIVNKQLLQRVFRGGGRDRKQLLLEHCGAIEIQRHTRGFLATMHVYDSIYKITMVQSVIRRHKAISYATDRMVFIIQSQSLARGFLSRQRMFWQYYAATVIQATWRGFSNRLAYQTTLLDIVIAQTVARRRMASLEFYRGREVRDNRSVKLIQTAWRSSNAQMAHQLTLFDIVISQTVVRRKFARLEFYRRREIRDNGAATIMQTKWRGTVARMTYQLTLVDIIIAQSVVRRKFARLESDRRREVRDNQAAAIMQTKWRGFYACTNYQLIWCDIVIAQNVVRCKLTLLESDRRRQVRDNKAARMNQTKWRSAYARMVYQLIWCDIVISQIGARHC
jgi:hypothetical protein